MKIKIFTIAEVPQGLEQKWLQHLRDFDTAHPDCHFVVCQDAPDTTMAEMMESLKVEPALTFTEIFKRQSSKT